MIVQVGYAEKETFVRCYIIKFENSLIFQTKELLWVGKEVREKIKRDFLEVIDGLELSGHTILGRDLVENS